MEYPLSWDYLKKIRRWWIRQQQTTDVELGSRAPAARRWVVQYQCPKNLSMNSLSRFFLFYYLYYRLLRE